MQVGSHGQSVVLVQNMRCAGQVVSLVRGLWSIFGDFIEVVAAVAEIEQIPIIVIAPVLHVLAAKIREWMVRPLWRKELACGACC